MEMKYRSALCDLFSNKAERSSSCSTAKDSGCFCGQILIKGLNIVFPKAVSPQTEQGNVLDSRLKSLLKYSVVTLSVKVIVILSTPFSWLQSPGVVLLLHLRTERDKVMCLSFSSTTLIIHLFPSTGHAYCYFIFTMLY